MPLNTNLRGGLKAGDSAERPIVVSDEDDGAPSIEKAHATLLRKYGALDLTPGFPKRAQGQESQSRYRYSANDRNAPLESSHISVPVWKLEDDNLELETCVELREPFGKWGIQFIEVREIWVPRVEGCVIIRGIPYARKCKVEGMPRQRNEICQILAIDDDDDRPDEVQCLFEINPRQISRVRILYKTNADYPDYQYGNDRDWFRKTESDRVEQAPLTCRSKVRVGYENSLKRKNSKRQTGGEHAFIRITQDEACPQFRCCDKERTYKWLGQRTNKGGSYKPQVAELDAEEGQKYTFFDVCCGAGGATRGAEMAGLKVVGGVDHCAEACATWSRNFPDARVFQQDITDFIQSHGLDLMPCRVDFVHFSLPCQEFSPHARSHRGRHDGSRKNLLLVIPYFLEKHHIRGFTFEQTNGLLDSEHKPYFDALLRRLEELGWTFRWKVIDCREYGLPQKRYRLVMFGVCPGERLPPWPPTTHSDDPSRGLKPFVGEAQAIQGLNINDPLHDVERARVCNDTPRDGNEPHKNTITCSGTRSINHFDGERGFTDREIACLQGFPSSHEFLGNTTSVKRQIGNAFPPCVVKLFYEHLRNWFECVDRVHRAPATAGVNQISDDDGERDSSVPAASASVAASIDEISDDDEEQQSPVSAVMPLMERMSIARSDAQPGHGTESDLRHSVTLSPDSSPSPGPSRQATASQKRSLGLMHDEEVDEVMETESAPKRKRTGVEHHDRGVADKSKIPSKLPYYSGLQNVHDSDDENVVVGRSARGSSQNGSVPEDRDSQRGTAVEDIATGESGTHWSSILSRARTAGHRSNEAWTF